MKVLISSLLIILLTGCIQTQALVPENTPGLLTTESPKPTSIIATIAPPKPSDAHLLIQCLDIEAKVPPGIVLNGTLVLDSRVIDSSGRYINFDTYFMDMATRTAIQVTQAHENLENFVVSADRKWIAYSDSMSDANNGNITLNLVVAADNNQIYKALTWEEEWGSFNWLDNQSLIIEIYQPSTPSIFATLESISFLVLNPFTGERKILQPDFPIRYDVPPLPNWGGWVETVYDPKMTRVVYLQGEISGPFYYTLWDIQQSKQIIKIQIIGDLNAIPRWAPDGKKFALAPSLSANLDRYPSYELYSVDKNGEMTQLTHLTNYYPRVYIDDFSWSPDGRYIAFWFSFWQDTTISFDALGNRYLAVLDTTNGWVTNYCINGEKDASISSLRTYPPPLWSPDGKQILVQSQTSKDSFQAVLIDIQQNRAFKIAEDLAPVGWLTSKK